MRLKAFILVGLFLSPFVARADAPEELYRAGKFKDAAMALQSSWETSTKSSASLAYNAGTAWAQAGDFARAYGFLLSAEHLSPADREVKNNLAIVRDKLSAEARNINPVFPFGASITEVSPLSAMAWSVIVLLCFGLFLFSLNTGRFQKIAWAALMVGCVALIPAILLFWENSSPTAVVIQQGDLRSGPADTFSSIRSIPNGAWISVIDSDKAWRKVRFFSAREKKETVGWINSADLFPVE